MAIRMATLMAIDTLKRRAKALPAAAPPLAATHHTAAACTSLLR